MMLIEATAHPATAWRLVETRDSGIGVAERAALGTTARMVVWPSESLTVALRAIDHELETLDCQANRFRPDSEISILNRSQGEHFLLSAGLAEAMAVALAAAQWTEGLVDPTVGGSLVSLGYDRDFATIEPGGGDPSLPMPPAPGWSSVRLEGPLCRRPRGVVLDLGATAKALGADRAAMAAFGHLGNCGGILVSLGGDIALAGQAPAEGWPILVVEDPDSHRGSATQVVRLDRGAVATSSIACRRWRLGEQEHHHIIDPRTGLPSAGPWRTATVAAASCAEANAASTALMVDGAAVEWLSRVGLPARLVRHDGSVCLLGRWPEEEQGALQIPPVDHLGPRVTTLRVTP